MIGVFGGTFDPIHFGHLRPALELLQGLPLREIRFVPLRTAVHRTQPVATAAQRLAMVRAAVAGQPGFVADDRELRRTGDSYSYDTLASLRAELGPRLPICLLTGRDAFAELPTWYRWRDIADLAHWVVMRRPGADAATDPELRHWMAPRLATDPAVLPRTPGGRVLFRDVTQLDISATAIRARIALGLSPGFLLPEGVLAFIEREGLYRP
ncbi:MAG: nicotinate-nucleotide adenylyltransferase [Candidatus Thiosymbion ectosymbiont of Robbea hypermnestra]|nr:nicotinate-nucleotide adenylyltransferase [Candidatus Thiosymbion ectosymbiont of Robbea hypermnestra]